VRQDGVGSKSGAAGGVGGGATGSSRSVSPGDAGTGTVLPPPHNTQGTNTQGPATQGTETQGTETQGGGIQSGARQDEAGQGTAERGTLNSPTGAMDNTGSTGTARIGTGQRAGGGGGGSLGNQTGLGNIGPETEWERRLAPNLTRQRARAETAKINRQCITPSGVLDTSPRHP